MHNSPAVDFETFPWNLLSDHGYERLVVNSVSCLVTAAGGAPLYALGQPEPGRQAAAKVHHLLLVEVDDHQLTGTTIDQEGQVIDRFELTTEE